MRKLDLRRTQYRLFMERARLANEIARVEREREAVFRQGVETGSDRVQRIVARRVLDLQRQEEALARTLRLARRQSLLLGYLVFARENGDRLDAGSLATVDWLALLEAVAKTAAAQAALEEKLDGILAILAGPAAAAPGPPPTPGPPRPAGRPLQEDGLLVASVPDGDGLRLEDGRRVRYLGIDAPEMGGRDRAPEPFAEEARELNRRLVVGRRVHLERDTSEADRYGRLLRYVYQGDTLVNAELLRAGLATALALWPDERHALEFLQLEQEARRRGRGMWAGSEVRG